MSGPLSTRGLQAPTCGGTARPAIPDAVRASFQPIERLRTGEIVGFESLARLAVGDALLPPVAFLADLTPADLVDLFYAMLEQALGLLRSVSTAGFAPYVSVNLEPTILLSTGFLDRLRRELARHRYGGGSKLVIELLECDRILDFGAIADALTALNGMEIGVALDDVGSAYASLTHLRELPVGLIKLDQSFARRLKERPDDLHFTLSLQSLANGLGKRLIVEGVETPEIHDALRVLGVEFGQGYGIARPMPLAAVGPWLAARRPRDPDLAPTSILGAYAGHLKVVETCRVLMEQPLPVTWEEESKDPHICSIGRYFDRHGVHDTAYGCAHKAFHAVMALYATDRDAWQVGADGFRKALADEMLASDGIQASASAT